MKNIALILIIILTIIACKGPSKENVDKKSKKATESAQKETATSKAIEKSNSGTYLCKINGKDWAYTKASGIISKNRKTQKRMAFITFTKKLERGSESVQLRYDADSFQLHIASIQLRFKNKEGKLFTCYYELFPDTKKKSPNATKAGSIDLSDSSVASGTAEITNLNIKYESEKLEDPTNATISLSDLKFVGVGYSDVEKVANTFK